MQNRVSTLNTINVTAAPTTIIPTDLACIYQLVAPTLASLRQKYRFCFSVDKSVRDFRDKWSAFACFTTDWSRPGLLTQRVFKIIAKKWRSQFGTTIRSRVRNTILVALSPAVGRPDFDLRRVYDTSNAQILLLVTDIATLIFC